MGRIRNWIDRMSGRRRDASHREVSRSRRRLAFERCEPRLTLSAAAPTAIDDSPNNPAILFDAVGLQDIGLQTYDSITWEQAQFQIQSTPGLSTPFELRDGLRASLNAQGGGIVDLNAFSLGSSRGNSVATEGAPTLLFVDATQSVINAAFGSQNFVPQLGTSLLHANGQSATLEMSFNDSSYQPDLPDWNTFVPSEPDNGPAFQETANLYGNGGNLESEMIRIDAPKQRQDTEGGTIELTAMLGPQPSLSARAPLRLAATRGLEGNAGATTNSPALSPRQLTATEGLRARAVVVTVSLLREPAMVDDSAALSPSANDSLNGEEAPAAEIQHAHLPAARQPSGKTANVPEVEMPAAAQRTAEATANEPAPAEAPRNDGETAAVERSSAFDAAFGDWAPTTTVRDVEADVSLAVSHDRRFVGVAVALVVGAGPIVHRARRARGALPAEVEEAGGLR